MLQKPEVERYEYEDNSHIHGQPFPEKISEEQEIHADYDGYH